MMIRKTQLWISARRLRFPKSRCIGISIPQEVSGSNFCYCFLSLPVRFLLTSIGAVFRVPTPAVCTREKGSTTVPAGKFFRTGIGYPHDPFSVTLIDTVNVFCRHRDALPFSKGSYLCLFLFRLENVLQFRYEIGHFHNT
jgi:hypothetical protein